MSGSAAEREREVGLGEAVRKEIKDFGGTQNTREKSWEEKEPYKERGGAEMGL